MNFNRKKIAIIGNAGSGKTTLAFQLQQKLKLPLYHLDQYAWEPDWQRIDFEKFSAVHETLCKRDEWILEGLYVRLIPQRIYHADVVIFLDTPRSRCIWYVFTRALLNFGKVIPGNPIGCKQRIFSYKFLDFLKYVWSFKHRHRLTIVELLSNDFFSNKKEIYVLKSPKEISAFLLQFQ